MNDGNEPDYGSDTFLISGLNMPDSNDFAKCPASKTKAESSFLFNDRFWIALF